MAPKCFPSPDPARLGTVLLTIDVGNTETVVGLFDEDVVVRCWRLATERRRTADELALLLRGFLADDGFERRHPERALVASVVPVLDRAWDGVCDSLGIDARFLTASTAVGLPIRVEVDEPSEVGADRLANTMAIAERSQNAVVVDLGTATTFDCITREGVFLGGVIAPGPLAGMERLAEAASKLMQVDLAPPESVIGRNTIACLGSGVFYSVVGRHRRENPPRVESRESARDRNRWPGRPDRSSLPHDRADRALSHPAGSRHRRPAPYVTPVRA
jgi:type III pantothenate kinase